VRDLLAYRSRRVDGHPAIAQSIDGLQIEVSGAIAEFSEPSLSSTTAPMGRSDVPVAIVSIRR